MFDEMVGPSRQAKQVRSELEAFNLIFSLDVLKNIARCTNRYAEDQRAAQPTNVKWTPVNLEDMMAFIGLSVAMGLDGGRCIKDFWKTDEPISHKPWFSTVMSRDRYCAILRYLHFNDQEDPADKLTKVRPLLNRFVANSQSHYTPAKNISIDEQLLGTKNRISFLQYLPLKHKKFGIKVWMLAEAKTGYAYNIQVIIRVHCYKIVIRIYVVDEIEVITMSDILYTSITYHQSHHYLSHAY